jgi:hypothetical protein
VSSDLEAEDVCRVAELRVSGGNSVEPSKTYNASSESDVVKL